jgi:hypothetical protein
LSGIWIDEAIFLYQAMIAGCGTCAQDNDLSSIDLSNFNEFSWSGF